MSLVTRFSRCFSLVLFGALCFLGKETIAFTGGHWLAAIQKVPVIELVKLNPVMRKPERTGLHHANSYQERANYKLLRVDNLQWYADDRTLENLFASLGEKVDCYLAKYDEMGYCMGYGFVIVPNEYVNGIMKYVDGTEADGLAIRVTEVDLEHLWTINHQQPEEDLDWQ